MIKLHLRTVWYGKGSCNTPTRLGGDIKDEAGDFYEKSTFGSSSEATLQITRVGIYKGTEFYPMGESYATILAPTT